ncbi:hypothetical protein BSKO_12247 [Bryopsis sp. KO-2023]|nr:hypothetical protein BSKO_12247 [Bryopsis sp. KO-2023]
MNPRHAAVLLLLLVFFGSEISAKTNDELLDECEKVGKAAGEKSVSQGCQAVKDKCPQGKPIVAKTSLPDVQLLPTLIRNTCETLYKTACLRAATESIKTNADDEAILLKGPVEDGGECNSVQAAFDIFEAGLISCHTFPDGLTDSNKDPCACAEDGVSGGVETGRPGCKEHGIAAGDSGFFCYVISPSECQGVKLTESKAFQGAFWKDC